MSKYIVNIMYLVKPKEPIIRMEGAIFKQNDNNNIKSETLYADFCLMKIICDKKLLKVELPKEI